VLGTGLAALILVVIIAVLGTGPENTNTGPAEFDPAKLLPGATVQLRHEGGTAAPVVTSRDLYKEWMKLNEAEDTLGVQIMTEQGQMRWTPNGTRAKILESHDLWDGSYNVRILYGPLYGQSVWTSKAFVKEDKPSSPSQRSGPGTSACPARPAPDTKVTIKFAGNSKTSGVTEG